MARGASPHRGSSRAELERAPPGFSSEFHAEPAPRAQSALRSARRLDSELGSQPVILPRQIQQSVARRRLYLVGSHALKLRRLFAVMRGAVRRAPDSLTGCAVLDARPGSDEARHVPPADKPARQRIARVRVPAAPPCGALAGAIWRSGHCRSAGSPGVPSAATRLSPPSRYTITAM